MFINIVIFVCSLFVQVSLMYFIDPESQKGIMLHFWNLVFAINVGVIIGSFFSLMLIFISWIFKSSYDLKNKLFYKRGILFGLLIFLVILLKFYNIFDKFIFIFLLVITIALDLIVIEEND